MSKRTPLAVSVGCPAGVGPLVAVRAAHQLPQLRCVLVGDHRVIVRAAATRGVPEEALVPVAGARDLGALRRGDIGVWQPSLQLRRLPQLGRPHAEAGAAQLSWIDAASDLVTQGHCSALVTGPVSKQVIARGRSEAEARFRGHTEHLAARLGVERVVMAFSSARLTVALATTHLPLAQVPAALDEAAVVAAVLQLSRYLAQLHDRPARIAVTGLNPHAGERGLLGDEEVQVITPALKRARRRLRRQAPGAQLDGPLGAETAFRHASTGSYDGVVAMYHDQATIACKLLGFGEMVNVTLGLPIIRVSVDHGTAYDAAARGVADADGMRSAMQLAARLRGRWRA